jgi:hypothetical protein
MSISYYLYPISNLEGFILEESFKPVQNTLEYINNYSLTIYYRGLLLVKISEPTYCSSIVEFFKENPTMGFYVFTKVFENPLLRSHLLDIIYNKPRLNLVPVLSIDNPSTKMIELIKEAENLDWNKVL